jgi:Polysaccharide lyase family 4, domain II
MGYRHRTTSGRRTGARARCASNASVKTAVLGNRVWTRRRILVRRIKRGRVAITASLKQFDSTTRPIELLPGGCVEQFIQLKPRTGLSGVVLKHDGQPADNTRIELLSRNAAGHWYHTYQFWTQSDKTGRFKFEDVPTGEYLIGYEIWGGQPSIDSAVPTTYYPDVSDESKATIVRLAPDQRLADIKLRLQRPHVPRRLTVVVTWPDGTPPGGNLLEVFANDELVKNVGGRPLGQSSSSQKSRNAVEPDNITFTGYQERQYRISARYWVDDLGGPVPYDQQRLSKTNVAVIEPRTGPSSVHLVLGRPNFVEE